MGIQRSADGPRSLYQQLKDHIQKKISSGDWQPGARIPSEKEFVEELGISRMTVNRAIREMADKGFLVRFPGVGTFVAEDRPQSGLLNVVNIANEIRGRGHDYTCDVIRVARESATLEVAAALGLGTGESVFHSICLHRENGVPIQIEDRFVNPKAAPDFIDQDFGKIQPSDYLLKTVPLDEVEHVVDAAPASSEEAEFLNLRAGQACLVLTRRTWANQLVVTFVRCIHPGSRYRLGTRFQVKGQQWLS
jgi:GntR family histidine utilization transcriptional repressor